MHTADNHLGLEFRNQPLHRDRLKQERMDALARIVEEANARGCHFLVVAGDLFDHVHVPVKLVRDACDLLKRCTGEVLILPGNHDYYEGPESRLWRLVADATIGTHIHLLTEYAPVTFPVEEREVVFYPCHCPSKHGESSLTGWVALEGKSPEALHIGIAHGNVEGLGWDDEGNYFHMGLQDLRSAGVACWLLGHIHTPSPVPGYTGPDMFLMPGSHTPEHVKRTTEGYAWYIEAEGPGAIRCERFRSGRFRFRRHEKSLQGPAHIDTLRRELQHAEVAQTLLDLRLQGRLTEEEMSDLMQLEQSLRDQYLDVALQADILKRIDAGKISAAFPDGSYPNRLLTALSMDPSDGHALQLAYDLITIKES